jgi:hypothetical protein
MLERQLKMSLTNPAILANTLHIGTFYLLVDPILALEIMKCRASSSVVKRSVSLIGRATVGTLGSYGVTISSVAVQKPLSLLRLTSQTIS